jgi:hypothetical protein
MGLSPSRRTLRRAVLPASRQATLHIFATPRRFAPVPRVGPPILPGFTLHPVEKSAGFFNFLNGRPA